MSWKFCFRHGPVWREKRQKIMYKINNWLFCCRRLRFFFYFWACLNAQKTIILQLIEKCLQMLTWIYLYFVRVKYTAWILIFYDLNKRDQTNNIKHTSAHCFCRLIHRKNNVEFFIIWFVYNLFSLTLLRPKMAAILSRFFIQPGRPIGHALSTVHSQMVELYVLFWHLFGC